MRTLANLIAVALIACWLTWHMPRAAADPAPVATVVPAAP